MKPQALIITFVFIFSFVFANAQHVAFPTEGVIRYEKRVNVFAILQKKIDAEADANAASVLETYKKVHPQFIVLESELRFYNGGSLFVPENSPPSPLASYFGEDPLMTQINTVYIDLQTHSYTTQKRVRGKTYVVKDTLLDIKWKITDEVREIAGYQCRRANGLMYGSLYVVAFYTNDIHLPVGPESFHGLPGAILGVALPHHHVSWFASEVNTNRSTDQPVQPPTDGDQMTSTEFREVINNLLLSGALRSSQVVDHYFQ